MFQISVQEDSEGEGLVAHFPAHTSEAIAAMEFDPSGEHYKDHGLLTM